MKNRNDTSPGRILWVLAAVLLCARSAPGAQTFTSIHDVNFARVLRDKLECDNDARIIKKRFASLLSDGTEQAIIEGYTCMTGTAGPDIHGIFDLDHAGQLQKLKVAEPDVKYLKTLFGNINDTLDAADGRLIALYSDTSERSKPLVVHYRWTGKEFAVDSVEASKPFKTSYDCSKARREADRAICYVEPLAKLDRRLGRIFRKRLTATKDKAKLKQSQSEWLRKRDARCPIYKFWVDCLKKAYEERIGELSHD